LIGSAGGAAEGMVRRLMGRGKRRELMPGNSRRKFLRGGVAQSSVSSILSALIVLFFATVSRAETPAPGPVVVFTAEAAGMQLSHYEKDVYRGEPGVRLAGSKGSAQCTFKGAAGSYDIRLRYADTPSGSGSLALYVNGRKVDSWELNRKYVLWTTRRIRHIRLANGDAIRIEAAGDGKEQAWLNALTVSTPFTFSRFDEGTDNTPPMGWSPWNFSHGLVKNSGTDPSGRPYEFNEAYCKAVADAFVAKGLRDLGYRWVMIPNTRNLRDEYGVLTPQWPDRFPHGYEPVIRYYHSKNLRVLMYTDGGYKTCGPGGEQGGNYKNEQLDADTFADWGADGLKMDWCGGSAEKLIPHEQYPKFSQALLSTVNRVGRPMQLEICSWGIENTYRWAPKIGSYWRTAGDIDIPCGIGTGWACMLRNLEANRHPESAGPDKGWNYADMLEVGVPGGLDAAEEQAMFGLWCLEASPLMLGNDILHDIPPQAWAVITNKEVIAVDQDPLGIQGDKVRVYGEGDLLPRARSRDPLIEVRDNDLEVWSKPLTGGARAVGLFNKTSAAASISVHWTDIGLSSNQKAGVRDLWNHRDLGSFTDSYSATVEPHSLALVKITPAD
jgi:alpha-galactosidase